MEAPAEEDDEQDGADGSAGGSTAASALFGGVTGAEVARQAPADLDELLAGPPPSSRAQVMVIVIATLHQDHHNLTLYSYTPLCSCR
mgnify:CR=1 FL=1